MHSTDKISSLHGLRYKEKFEPFDPKVMGILLFHT